MIRNDHNGYLFSAASEATLAKLLEAIEIIPASAYQALSIQARQASQSFRPASVASGYLEVYQAAIDAHSAIGKKVAG